MLRLCKVSTLIILNDVVFNFVSSQRYKIHATLYYNDVLTVNPTLLIKLVVKIIVNSYSF